MPEDFDNRERLRAVLAIVEAANKKTQELCADRACVPVQSLLDLMQLVTDATSKVTHMRWTDSAGLRHGVGIYIQTIENI